MSTIVIIFLLFFLFSPPHTLLDSVGVVELEIILYYELLMQDCLGGMVPVEFYWQFMMVWWGTVEMIKSFLYCILFTLLHKLFVALR